MKMVPKTDPLGCFLYNFDPHCPKKTTTHNTTNFLFRNLGRKIWLAIDILALRRIFLVWFQAD
jgi:hypothetical protein